MGGETPNTLSMGVSRQRVRSVHYEDAEHVQTFNLSLFSEQIRYGR